jgi:PAS domain S-box-containing protein
VRSGKTPSSSTLRPQRAVRGGERSLGDIDRSNQAAPGLTALRRKSLETRAASQNTAEPSRDLFDLAPDGMFETSLNGRLIGVNPAMASLLGYDSLEDIRSHVENVSELYVDQSRRTALFDAVQRHGIVRDFEVEQVRKDGATIQMSVTAHLRGDGPIPTIAGLMVDITDRKRLEADLLQAQAQLRRLIDSNVIGVVIEREDGSVIEANDYYLDLIGFTRAELERGQVDWRSITPSEWQAADEVALGELRTRGKSTPYEKEYLRRDGSRVPVLVTTTAWGPGKQGATFVLDISVRKHAEAAVGASAAAMRSSLDAMIDPFLMGSSVRDVEGQIVGFRLDFANRAVGDFIGESPETLLDPAVSDRVLRLRGRCFHDVVRDVVTSGREWCEDAVDFVLPGPDGGEISGKANLQVVRFGDGFFAAWRDVTERESALSTLRASERRAIELVENSADGILISGADGRYIEANLAMSRMLGYSREELLAMHAGDLTADDDPIGNVAMHKRLAEPQDEVGFLTERRYRRRDGTSLPVEVRFSILSGGRQQRNVRDISERLASEATVARDARIHVALMQALDRVAADATIEEAGQVICDALDTLPSVDFTGFFGFFGDREVVMLSGTVPAMFPTRPGDSVPQEQAQHIQMRTGQGPWAVDEATIEAFGEWGRAAHDAGLKAAAFGPVVYGKRVVGVLAIGTDDPSYAKVLVGRMPEVPAFTAAISGLLAERLYGRRLEADLRRRIGQILTLHSFHPVFQPIVDLASKVIVGYEALTRFDSGQQPDLCIADAWSVGLGPEMELATLEAAIAAGKRLPSGRWLDLNVSPRLLDNPDRLRTLLWGAERPIVVEITEHEIIDDYSAVREAIRALGNDVRLAVDDAGAGIANFGHIVELRPDLVKLDITLVRRINANLGRQALVVGMRHFSRTAGCRLVAEGVETEEEAGTLRGFGVEFGQGYLFGRGEPVEAWAEGRGTA